MCQPLLPADCAGEQSLKPALAHRSLSGSSGGRGQAHSHAKMKQKKGTEGSKPEVLRVSSLTSSGVEAQRLLLWLVDIEEMKRGKGAHSRLGAFSGLWKAQNQRVRKASMMGHRVRKGAAGRRQGLLGYDLDISFTPPALTILGVDSASIGDITMNEWKQAQEILGAPRVSKHRDSIILPGEGVGEGFAKKIINITSPGRGTPGEALGEPGYAQSFTACVSWSLWNEKQSLAQQAALILPSR